MFNFLRHCLRVLSKVTPFYISASKLGVCQVLYNCYFENVCVVTLAHSFTCEKCVAARGFLTGRSFSLHKGSIQCYLFANLESLGWILALFSRNGDGAIIVLPWAPSGVSRCSRWIWSVRQRKEDLCSLGPTCRRTPSPGYDLDDSPENLEWDFNAASQVRQLGCNQDSPALWALTKSSNRLAGHSAKRFLLSSRLWVSK